MNSRSAIKFGVWGLGRIGFVHIKHFSHNLFNLVAGCDCEQEKLDTVNQEYGAVGYSEPEEFLNHPDMELVIICTRSIDHVTHAEQALKTGKYVLLEKPIAVTEEDLIKLRKADTDYPGKLFFLHNHRFEPAFQTIYGLAASGVLGDIHTIKLCRHQAFARRMDWQSMLKYGGGQLSCWGPHILDHALQLLQSPVKDVWSNLKHIHALGDADDYVKIVLRGENDAVADIEISDSIALQGDFCSIYGSRGALVCPDEKTVQLKYIDENFHFEEVSVKEASPSLTKGENWKNDNIPWIQKTIEIESENSMWVEVEIETGNHLYKALRENIPFPIKNEDAFEIVRITNLVKQQNSQFDWLQ